MKKILIVDDEPNILMLTGIMLEDAGYKVVMAKNGAQAIDKAFEEKPDLIITDIVMPEKDGFEVCKTLRGYDEFVDVPIIILSAIGDEFNKITGFEGGADDYITKPFNLEELLSRVQTLLVRKSDQKKTKTAEIAADTRKNQENYKVDRVDTGIQVLNEVTKGGLPKGSNVLLTGPLGSGKSTLARHFIATGVKNRERNMFITLDDSPQMIAKKMNDMLERRIEEYTELNLFHIVDAYSWSSGANIKKQKFAIDGILDLNQLHMVTTDASQALGQTIQSKLGGRRVIDSISSLLINFDLSIVQRFVSQLARTAVAFGMVNTVFVLEEGTVSDHILNNIKYIMDGIIETKEDGNEFYLRVASMKWIDYDRDWVKVKL